MICSHLFAFVMICSHSSSAATGPPILWYSFSNPGRFLLGGEAVARPTGAGADTDGTRPPRGDGSRAAAGGESSLPAAGQAGRTSPSAGPRGAVEARAVAPRAGATGTRQACSLNYGFPNGFLLPEKGSQNQRFGSPILRGFSNGSSAPKNGRILEGFSRQQHRPETMISQALFIHRLWEGNFKHASSHLCPGVNPRQRPGPREPSAPAASLEVVQLRWTV